MYVQAKKIWILNVEMLLTKHVPCFVYLLGNICCRIFINTHTHTYIYIVLHVYVSYDVTSF